MPQVRDQEHWSRACTRQGPARGRRRGGTSASIRARLSQGTVLRPEFEYELLAMFVRNELSARVTVPLLAVIFSLASMFWAPVLQASAWLALVISAKFFMIAACRKFLAQPRGEVRVDAWRQHIRLARAGERHRLGRHGRGGLRHRRHGLSHVFMLTSLIVLLAIRMTFASTRDDDPLRRHHPDDGGRRARA